VQREGFKVELAVRGHDDLLGNRKVFVVQASPK
jgi:hypothetical protein